MIVIAARAHQYFAVLGLGLSGIAAARALLASGARVIAWDDGEEARATAQVAGLPLADLERCDWSTLSALVLSPGIPLTHPAPHPLVARALNQRVPIIGDIELLLEARPEARFVGITGTNGKSTTTALLGHILATAGKTVEVGGNIGRPALGLAPLGREGHYILELSSYQLDLTHQAAFDVAIFLNLTPDHLDRHGSMEGYLAAKMRIFRAHRDGRAQTAIIGVDDAFGPKITAELSGRQGWRTIAISAERTLERGVYAQDGKLFDAIDGKAAAAAIDLAGVKTLRGAHNWQNAAAACAAARALGLTTAAIAQGLATYPGLPHRQETVATIGGVEYVNDSKATNGEAAARALAAFDTIYWIAGGLAKADGLSPTLPLLGRVRHAFLIGKAEPAFAAELAGKVPMTPCGALDKALAAAHALAQSERRTGAVVLLSPACASFDQWRNFEARGDGFRAMVQAIAERGAP